MYFSHELYKTLSKPILYKNRKQSTHISYLSKHLVKGFKKFYENI